MAAQRNFDSFITSPPLFRTKEIGSSKKVGGRRRAMSSLRYPLMPPYEILLKNGLCILKSLTGYRKAASLSFFYTVWCTAQSEVSLLFSIDIEE
jgi:hypothetical protein